MYIYRLAHALGDLGHNVEVIHCINSYHLQHPAEPEIKFKEHPNVIRHGLESKVGWLSPLATQQTGRPFFKSGKIQEILNSKHFDVIHFHNISLLGPKIMEIKPPDGQVVKIYTTHEHWLICPMHVLWKFNTHACDKPECLKCIILGKRPPQLWRYLGLLDKTSQHVDKFVSPSRFTAQMHADRGFSKKVTPLPYFIERVDRDWQNPGPRHHEEPYFLFVGRLEFIKGLHTLINLWNKVPDYDLVVVGTGKQEKELRILAENNPRIKFLGALPQQKLGPLYYHALATVVPSITYETFGIIIIESFARKTPVIVRNLGALPEVVQESGGGFQYNTDEELLNSIKRIGGEPNLRSLLGEKGYDHFVKTWSREAHMKQYFETLNSIAIGKYGFIPWENS